MKKVFKSLLVAAIAMVATVALADVGITDLVVTNKVTASNLTTANVSGNSAYLSKSDRAGIELQCQGNAVGTGAITLTLQRSLDGTVWETTPTLTWATALNGTTALVAYTNLTADILGSAAYLRIYSISNGNATADATNVVVRVIRKTLKPSP